jgi:hypothetical protein
VEESRWPCSAALPFLDKNPVKHIKIRSQGIVEQLDLGAGFPAREWDAGTNHSVLPQLHDLSATVPAWSRIANVKVFYYSNPKRPTISAEESAKRQAEQRARSEKRNAQDVAREQQEGDAQRSLLNKTKSYLKAEAKHAWGGPAPMQVFEERLKACLACPGRVDELDGISDDGGVGFCTKCGCGANQRSRLSVKLTLAGVPCPLGKFGVVEGTGGTIASAVEAAKGVAASAIDLVRKKFADDR